MITEELIEKGKGSQCSYHKCKKLKENYLSNKNGGKEGRTKDQKMRKEKDKQKERERERVIFEKFEKQNRDGN